MSRSFKQSVVEAISNLLSSVCVSPQPGRTLVSQPLHDAIAEIEDEVNSNRTNWHLVTALTGVKSYIVTIPNGRNCEETFWAEERGEDEPSIYAILDGLHFRAAVKVGVLPSGMTVFVGTPDGIGKQSGEVDTSASCTSPTLRLIAAERARIEAGSAEVRSEPTDD